MKETALEKPQANPCYSWSRRIAVPPVVEQIIEDVVLSRHLSPPHPPQLYVTPADSGPALLQEALLRKVQPFSIREEGAPAMA
ncbi:hypothetical protein NDU88_001453 [Pleurodeles waltl]|uniref:Uncharacterized protein n=1 Tax=Pleurodeles waltl TaxID=8319 RepID=A0AAV7KPL2_PLEWA|nr:hypothetical protein NDU88_001453 [Pleurodeles waltl]